MMWAPYYGNDGAIVAFLAMMREHGITVEEALAAHESELAEMMQDMVAAGESATVAQQTGNIDARLLPGEEVMGKCPDCGATVAGKALCPAKEPPFRCRMACTSEDCSWWGKSTRTPAELRKAGTLADVEEQHRGAEGHRTEGYRAEGHRAEGQRTEGQRTEGQRTEGQRAELN